MTNEAHATANRTIVALAGPSARDDEALRVAGVWARAEAATLVPAGALPSVDPIAPLQPHRASIVRSPVEPAVIADELVLRAERHARIPREQVQPAIISETGRAPSLADLVLDVGAIGAVVAEPTAAAEVLRHPRWNHEGGCALWAGVKPDVEDFRAVVACVPRVAPLPVVLAARRAAARMDRRLVLLAAGTSRDAMASGGPALEDVEVREHDYEPVTAAFEAAEVYEPAVVVTTMGKPGSPLRICAQQLLEEPPCPLLLVP